MATSIFTRAFWRDAAERTISSAAQGALVGWGAGAFTAIGEVVTAAEAAALGGLGMGVATLLKCIAVARTGDPGTASAISLASAAGAHEATGSEGVDTHDVDAEFPDDDRSAGL